jgi:uncharacterized protein (TIGR03435 family)
MTAYTVYTDDPEFLRVVRRPSIEGGPAWADTDLYFVEARTERPARQATIRGPMLQALLEERFRLKVHRETRQASVYALTVNKQGPHLHPTSAGSCASAPSNSPDANGRHPCGSYQVVMGRGPNGRKADSWGMSIDQFVTMLPMCGVDRPVVNRTGIAGMFDFHLEFATGGVAELHGDGLTEPIAPSIAVALEEQLGLKMAPAIGPLEFLVIDHAQRPAEN